VQSIYLTFTRMVGPLLGVISWAEVHGQLASLSQMAQHARAWRMNVLERKSFPVVCCFITWHLSQAMHISLCLWTRIATHRFDGPCRTGCRPNLFLGVWGQGHRWKHRVVCAEFAEIQLTLRVQRVSSLLRQYLDVRPGAAKSTTCHLTWLQLA